MTKKYKFIILGLVILGLIVAAGFYLHRTNVPVVEPRGLIASRERRLMIVALLLALIVVVPVFTLLFVFAWHYRESNSKAKYSPELAGNRAAEVLWWLIPSAIILVLSVITWRASHELDPYKALAASNKAINIQVVALDWKWLFIYPGQRVASVNYFELPLNTPVNFYITSDSVMNSFWLPQLGGQIYAMPGMLTQLHLIANQAGSYNGSSANISGQGFAGMTFVAKATSTAGYANWLSHLANVHSVLNSEAYNQLIKPSQNNPVAYYSRVQPGLYYDIIAKYMLPISGPTGSSDGQKITLPYAGSQ